MLFELSPSPAPTEKPPVIPTGGAGGLGRVDLRIVCPRCGAEPFAFCREVPGDVRFSMGHRERK